DDNLSRRTVIAQDVVITGARVRLRALVSSVRHGRRQLREAPVTGIRSRTAARFEASSGSEPSVSGALPQARSGRRRALPEDHRDAPAEGSSRRSRHLQLQPTGIQHQREQSAGAVRRPAAGRPAVEREHRPAALTLFPAHQCVCVCVFTVCVLLQVGHHTDITVESLSLFYLLEPRIEILVLGTGARTERLDPNVLDFLKKKGIAVEVQDTPNACATFNFLSSERRLAAAGLIPPPAAE
uniref:NADH dehydrogenase [ubiquinone] 1 alpha subcomplex assembly factor 3 n=1 Tax=Cyprinus carpio carpio TaxID=630221 RepID=A0A9J8C9M9_CYPCA